MAKFVLLTLLDGSPVVVNTSNIDIVQPLEGLPESSEIVDMEGSAIHVMEEVKLVYEYIIA